MKKIILYLKQMIFYIVTYNSIKRNLRLKDRITNYNI